MTFNFQDALRLLPHAIQNTQMFAYRIEACTVARKEKLNWEHGKGTREEDNIEQDIFLFTLTAQVQFVLILIIAADVDNDKFDYIVDVICRPVLILKPTGASDSSCSHLLIAPGAARAGGEVVHFCHCSRFSGADITTCFIGMTNMWQVTV